MNANKMRSLFAGRLTLGIAIAALGLAVPPAGAQTHQPADKIQVSASNVEVLNTQPQPVTLLTATLKTSSPADLIFNVTAECALVTDLTSPLGEADARITVWVEVDGNPVPVTSDPAKGGPDDGRVTFANRALRVVSPDILQIFLRTKAANAFTWGTLNVGSGVHAIEVKAQLDADAVGGFAQAAVGKRTLVVEPVHLINDVVI